MMGSSASKPQTEAGPTGEPPSAPQTSSEVAKNEVKGSSAGDLSQSSNER